MGKIFCFLKLLCDSPALKKNFVGVINRVEIQCMHVLVVRVCVRESAGAWETVRGKEGAISQTVYYMQWESCLETMQSFVSQP